MTDAFIFTVLVWSLVTYFVGMAAVIWGLGRER